MYERSRVSVKMGLLLPLRAAFHTSPLFYLSLDFLFNNKLLLLNNVIIHGISTYTRYTHYDTAVNQYCL